MTSVLKSLALGVATLLVLPSLVSYWIRGALMGRDRALEGSTQALALLPGLTGQYLRRAFLMRALDACASTATIEFGTIFSQAGARIDAYAYVGPRCHLGLVHLGEKCMLGAGVHVTSGRHTHGSSESGGSLHDQAIVRARVDIGAGAWIGSAAVIMADVGPHAIIGAGAVVTKPIPAHTVAAGVPARPIAERPASVPSVTQG